MTKCSLKTYRRNTAGARTRDNEEQWPGDLSFPDQSRHLGKFHKVPSNPLVPRPFPHITSRLGPPMVIAHTKSWHRQDCEKTQVKRKKGGMTPTARPRSEALMRRLRLRMPLWISAGVPSSRTPSFFLYASPVRSEGCCVIFLKINKKIYFSVG